MKELTSRNLNNFKTRTCSNKIIFLISILLTVSFFSCKSVSKSVGNSDVYLYKGQADYLDGTYFVDPYRTNGEYKLLTEIFELENSEHVSKVDLKFKDDRYLHISYSDGKNEYKKVIKGKMKNGAFRYEHRFLPIGVPVILFLYNHKVHHIALGNDDDIVITEYEKGALHFFTFITSGKELNRYYFDRQLK